MPETFQSPILAWIQLALGLLAIVLALLTFNQANANREIQKVAASNQTRLERATTFANLDNSLIQLMAKSATESNDAAMMGLLAANGVTIRKGPADAGAKP